ncbi:MAG: hypothetical protein WAU23_13215 [Ferruginibacter sp.]
MKMNVGAWIGIAGGIIGILVAIISVVVTGGQEGIYIGAGILVFGGGMFYLFYKLLFAPMILASRLKKTGIAGKAVIREVRDTGVTINNSPQVKLVLEVKNSFGQKYTTTVRTLVSRLQPDMFQTGMTIPVLIDPKNENIVVIDFSGEVKSQPSRYSNTISSADENKLKDELTKNQQEGDMIRISGRSARAIVKKYTWLGIYVNGNNPYAEMEIEVMPDDKPAFAAKVKGAIKEESVSKYQPGEEIFVKYDLYDVTKVAIDHS